MIHIDLKFIHLLSPKLDKFKKLRDYLYNFRCPYCGDSVKFRNKARGYFYRKAETMLFRCHNCGKGTTAGKVIEFVDSDMYKEYVRERFVGNEEPTPVFEAPKFKKRDPKLEDLTPINKLNGSHPARQFVESRQIPEEFYNDLFLCSEFFSWAKIGTLVPRRQEHPRLVIPFRDESGEVFAVQGRAFGKETPKYLTVKFDDKPKIFGLDRVDLSRRFYVVEGPIDSFFVDNCIAVAGADFEHLPLKVLYRFAGEGMTIVMDNEPRSREIIKRMENLIDNNHALVIWPDTITQKDINDMVLAGHKDVQEIINNNTFSGLTAKAKLSAWKRI